MSKRYAVYKLKKVAGKKEYEVSSYTVWNSLRAAYNDLEGWDEDLDGPRIANTKIGEFVAFEMHDRMIYIPNWTIVKDKEGREYWRLLGAYGWFPIYYIDVYPNPYSRYKLHKVRGRDELVLEGIK